MLPINGQASVSLKKQVLFSKVTVTYKIVVCRLGIVTLRKMADNSWSGVEKLKGSENYHTWQFAIRNLLELNDYADCIKADNDAEVDVNKLRKAKARIELSVCPSVYVHIENSKSAAETWKKLKDLYQDRGLSRRIGLLRKLVTTKLENCDSMNDYI